MPKISASTVAEHRSNQRAALLAAATAVLVEEGAAAVTPAAVGARAGLARSSVYQYFPSTADLLASIVQEAFPATNAALADAMAAAETPAERIDTYVTTMLRLAGEGLHRPVSALLVAEIPEPCKVWLHQLLRDQATPLVRAVRDTGTPGPKLAAQLVGGIVQAAVAAVEDGAPVRETTRRTLALIHGGLDAG